MRLVSGGLANNDVATRFFVSPRILQTHLTHVYTELGITSRVQLIQAAANHVVACAGLLIVIQAEARGDAARRAAAAEAETEARAAVAEAVIAEAEAVIAAARLRLLGGAAS